MPVWGREGVKPHVWQRGGGGGGKTSCLAKRGGKTAVLHGGDKMVVQRMIKMVGPSW